ncbi:unnamed protein product [Thelazia callipaeda]|uniref:PAP2_C domain-containing protein n=1 Tax=Thelazia callipaeda TaxID=103827 RepID=A0A0N5D7Y5_THECL|nr:unnamed protein product [Thelazia callipaeda]
MQTAFRSTRQQNFAASYKQLIWSTFQFQTCSFPLAKYALKEQRLTEEEGDKLSVVACTCCQLNKEGDEGDNPTVRITYQLIMSESSIKIHLRKLLFVLTFMLIAAFSNWIALAYIHDFVGRNALPDIAFAIMPELLWTLKVGDAMVTLCSVSFFALLFLHKNRLIIIQRTAFIVACLYTMRTISLLCTQLPSGYIDNSERCQAQNNYSGQDWNVMIWRVFSQATKLGFQDIDDKMLCGDLLFSGHTLAMVVSSLTVAYYLPNSLRLLRYIPWISAWIGMICMVISRTHYTVDVIFAYWLSTAVFNLYYSFCEIDLTNRRSSILHQLWMIRVVNWLEVDIPSGRFILFIHLKKCKCLIIY